MRSRPIWFVALVALLGSTSPAVAPVALASPASAATVIQWNAIASTAIVTTAGQPPHLAGLSIAIVQGAVYDAVNSIDGRHRPYLNVPPASPSASQDAAAATAAFRVLVGLFPGQLGTLQPLYDASLLGVQDGPNKDAGIAAGEAAATAMLDARAHDGRFGSFTFVIGTTAGAWRPTPPSFALDPAPWVGNVTPFLVPSAEMLRSDGPNAVTSAAYAQDYNEVKSLGSLTSTTRTADETDAAIFWQDHALALWNRVFRGLAESRGLDAADAARFFAMENMAAADGAIGCWNDKYYWNFWRPITAIREGDNDDNPATVGDPNWKPLFDPSTPSGPPPLVTPAFPDHPSGHSCASTAIVRTLQNFFGTDKIGFTAFSNKSHTSRTFARFSLAVREIINARVWGGIHFRTADTQGAVIGKKVAHWLVTHYFQPVD
jgi:PAP2 superfamily